MLAVGSWCATGLAGAEGERGQGRKDGAGRSTDGRKDTDYVILERREIPDPSGFGQPVPAFSVLLPKGWKIDGGIQWNISATCMTEVVFNRLTARSEDGSMSFHMFPNANWEWFDDPMMQQAKQMSAQMGSPGCPMARPLNAAQFLRSVLVPREFPGGRIASIEPNEAVTRALREQARQANAMFAGSAIELSAEAASAKLLLPNDRVGRAVASVMQFRSTMYSPLSGQNTSSYTCAAENLMAFQAPAANEAEGERLFATIMASIRINPVWLQAIQQMFMNVHQIQMQGVRDRSRIWRETQNEIGQMRAESWQRQQESRDRIAGQWSQAIRGVEDWKDPHTGEVTELTSGYSDAWSDGSGSYLLSSDPNFDPNQALQQGWRRMERSQ